RTARTVPWTRVGLASRRRPTAIAVLPLHDHHVLACQTATFGGGARQCSVLIGFLRRGFEVLPCRLPQLSSIFSTSVPAITRPNTGCCDGVLWSHQSRNELCAVLMKNWLPPLLGRPVLAIDSVPGSLENFALGRNSSWMLPLGGPPVPARDEFGSFE